MLAGTGDPAFGGTSYAGLGIFRTTDGGEHWHKATGVPAGTLTFSFAHDPANPTVVYAATSKGLYRSTDAGRASATSSCRRPAPTPRRPTCFFANIVTDVAVRQPTPTTKGGAVLAAVGWRAGHEAQRARQAPVARATASTARATGLPGSFAFRSGPAGFAADDVVGRVALGAALGPKQDHGYVYALVQDAQKFNGGATHARPARTPAAWSRTTPSSTASTAPRTSASPGPSSPTPRSWRCRAAARRCRAPRARPTPRASSPGTTSGSPRTPTTQDDAGVPGRIAFGLEEVWTGTGALPVLPNSSQYSRRRPLLLRGRLRRPQPRPAGLPAVEQPDRRARRHHPPRPARRPVGARPRAAPA